MLQPHHDGSPLHVIGRGLKLGDRVRVRLRVPPGHPTVAAVTVRANPDHEPRWSEAVALGSDDAGWSWWEAELELTNPRYGYRWLIRYDSGAHAWLNQAGISRIETRDVDDFAIVVGNPPPSWMTSSVMYEIFPDRFARSAASESRELPEWAIPADWSDPVDGEQPGRSHQLYGGDLDGIVDRLDHLAELGVDLIYLTPVFPGASNHRYDASSFETVDPLLGGDDALIRLVEAAHARGMRVIGDLTSNHSGDRHEWFQAAVASADAPEASFYYFRNEARTEYESWLGTATLPKFDWSSPELRRRFIEGPDSVVGKWLRPPYSLDGWRIDVANMTGRLGDIDLNAEVRTTIRRTMLEVNPETLLVAESTNDATEDYPGDGWHGAMTYADFTRPVWAWLSEHGTAAPADSVDADGADSEDGGSADGEDSQPWFFGQPLGGIPSLGAREVMDAYVRFTAGMPWQVRLGTMHALDTHDTARFATSAAPGALPLAVGLSVTLPGIPVVWMGDEFGLPGADGELSRTPMPWGSEHEARETLSLYRDLLRLRKAHPVLGTGGLRWLHADDEGFAFVRESTEECVIVLATRAGAEWQLDPALLPGGPAEAVFGSAQLDLSSGTIRAAGTVFAAWRTPGVPVPRSNAKGEA